MEKTKELLKEWGFSCLWETFEENEIDELALLNIEYEALKELIPKVGPRTKFWAKLKYYQEQERSSNNATCMDKKSLPHHADITSPTSSGTSTISVTEDSQSQEGVCCTYPQRASFGTPYVLSVHTNGVRELLEKSPEGELIIASYAANKKFLRSKLCEVIVKNELKSTPSKRIPTARFIQLADEINQIFLHERQEIYFVPYCKNVNGKPRSARGKLWSTYCYIRKTLRCLDLLPGSSTDQPRCLDETDVSGEELQDIELWLRNNAAPFTDVLLKWKLTTHIRRTKYPATIGEYLCNYPGLREPLGYILLEADFNNLYPEKEHLFYSAWSKLSKIVLKVALEKKDNYILNIFNQYKKRNIQEDEIFALTILPLLFPSTNLKSKKPGNYWRPSKVELQQGFILHVKNIVDLEPELERRRDKYALYNFNHQPVPVIVGELNNIEACYVCVENIKYKVDTPMKAVDLCFKIYFALDAEYPKECDAIWMFIQTYIYKIITNNDRKYVAVSTFISEIEKLGNGL